MAVAEATYRAAQQNLLVRVSQAYFDVLAAEDTLACGARPRSQAFNRQLEQAEKRFEVGLIAITDVQESRAAHDSATAAVIAAKRALASAQEALRELTGENYEALGQAGRTDAARPAAARGRADVGRPSRCENNLDVVAARLNVEVATGNVRVAQAGHFPTIDLFAQRDEIELRHRRRPTMASTGPGATRRPDRHDTIGVQVTIPDLQRRRDAFARAEQVYLQRATREKLEGTMRAAERETRDAYLGVIAEKARVQALQQSVKSNQTALEATEAGFEVGTRTTVDVLDARRRLFEAQRDYARSRYDYLINIVRLKSATGGLVADDLTAINGFLTQPTTLPVVAPEDLEQRLDHRDEAVAPRRDSPRRRRAPRAPAARAAAGSSNHARTAPPSSSGAAHDRAVRRLAPAGRRRPGCCACTGPTAIGRPSTAGSSRLCPPIGTRLPPTNATSAAA